MLVSCPLLILAVSGDVWDTDHSTCAYLPSASPPWQRTPAMVTPVGSRVNQRPQSSAAGHLRASTVVVLDVQLGSMLSERPLLASQTTSVRCRYQ